MPAIIPVIGPSSLPCARPQSHGKKGTGTAVAVLVDKLNKMGHNYAPEQVKRIDNRAEIAQRARLVGHLIAGKLNAAMTAGLKLLEAWIFLRGGRR